MGRINLQINEKISPIGPPRGSGAKIKQATPKDRLCLRPRRLELELRGNLTEQFDDAVGVAPLVVVPADKLEEVLVQLDGRAGVEN